MEQATITTAQLAQWLGQQTWSEFAQSLSRYFARTGALTPKQEASARKMYTKVSAKQEAESSKLDTDGIFAKGSDIYKVVFNQSKTSLYAKVLVVNGVRGEWEYAGTKPLYFLTEDDRLTAERAAELGKLYGMCVRCGRTLTHEDSIYNGYGETCAENEGWPYASAPALILA